MFEDILMGASRPSLVIQRYQELYSQERVEAYDAISDTELVDDAIVPEFLLDIMKASNIPHDLPLLARVVPVVMTIMHVVMQPYMIGA